MKLPHSYFLHSCSELIILNSFFLQLFDASCSSFNFVEFIKLDKGL